MSIGEVLIKNVITLKKIVDNDYGIIKGNAEMIDKHQIEINKLKKQIKKLQKNIKDNAKL